MAATIRVIDNSNEAIFSRVTIPELLFDSGSVHKTETREVIEQAKGLINEWKELGETRNHFTIEITSTEPSYESICKRWPRLVSHIICESLGYCTPECAASILWDAKVGRSNWCEMMMACYQGDARRFVRLAIKNRRYHKGYMADYRLAKAIVDRFVKHGISPSFASWF